MKIAAINTNYFGYNNKKEKAVTEAPKQNYINEYNPVYYMPSFKGSKERAFSNLFSKGLETDLTGEELNKLSDYIYDIKDSSIKDKNRFMGSGTFGDVYRIDDDYVLKVEKYYYNPKDRKFKYEQNNPFNNIPYYYGGVLAKCDNLSILKNADPKNEGILAGAPIWFDKKDGYEYLTKKSLPAYANLPQEAYNNYAVVLRILNGMSYVSNYDKIRFSPDVFNSNNFIITGDKIKIVDELFPIHKDSKNDICTMCFPFVNDIMHIKDKEINAETIENKREIFKKCVLAAEEADLPMPDNMYSQNRFQKVLDVCEYSVLAKNFCQNIESIRNFEEDKDVRKELISFYIDNLEQKCE